MNIFRLNDLPQKLTSFFLGSFQNWEPVMCLQAVDDFVTYVLDVMKDVDSPHTVFRFDFDPKTTREIQMQRYENQNEFSFLPEWFITGLAAREWLAGGA